MMMLGVEVDLVQIQSTPLQMLVVIVGLSLVAGLVVMVFTQVFAGAVDRKWPATEPLRPSEMLWAEAGGHVQKTFKGLDLELSKDLASHMVERKVPAGALVITQGEPASSFFVLKKGKAEAVQTLSAGQGGREEVVGTFGPGDTFGEVAILRRTARTASVRAVTDCVVLELPAEDFVAGASLSADEGNDLAAVVERYLESDRERSAGSGRETLAPKADPKAPRLEAAEPVPRTEPVEQVPPAIVPLPERPQPVEPVEPVPEPAATAAAGGWAATHAAPEAGLQAWATPDPTGSPIATLAAGVELQVAERAGEWARVVGSNGWEGWVDGRLLVARA